MESKNYFNCLEKGHENEGYVYICINQGCKENNRLFCAECVISSSHFKKELDSKNCIKIKDLLKSKQPNLEILINTDKRIQKIYNFYIENSEKIPTICQQIENLFEDLQKQIIQEIQKIKKILIQKLELNQQLYTEQKQKITENYDLSSVQKALNQLIEGLQTNYQVHKTIIKAFNNDQRITVQQQILDQFDKQKNILIFSEKAFNQQKQNILKYLSDFQDNLTVVDKKNISQLQFFNCQGLEKDFNYNKENKILIAKYQCFTNSFYKYQKVKLQFQIREDNNLNPYFFVGIHAEKSDQKYKFWGENGNSFCIKHNNNNQLYCQDTETVEYEGQHPSEIYQVGNIYEIEICVEQNLFQIKDSNELTIIKNKKILEQENDKWVIYFYLRQKQIQIFSYELEDLF